MPTSQVEAILKIPSTAFRGTFKMKSLRQSVFPVLKQKPTQIFAVKIVERSTVSFSVYLMIHLI